MMTENEIRTEKKLYSKPIVTEVHLVPGEAVLANCKQNNGLSNLCLDLLCSSDTPAS